MTEGKESLLRVARRKMRFGHVATKGDPWFAGIYWQLWPGDRQVSVYLWRLLVLVRLPGKRRRTAKHLWREWSLGEVQITWFDRARADV